MSSCDPFTPVHYKCSNWNEFTRLEKLESVLWTHHLPIGSNFELHETIPVALGDIKFLLAEAKKYSKLKNLIRELNCEDI